MPPPNLCKIERTKIGLNNAARDRERRVADEKRGVRSRQHLVNIRAASVQTGLLSRNS